MNVTLKQQIVFAIAMTFLIAIAGMTSFVGLEPAVSSAQNASDTATIAVDQEVDTTISIDAGGNITLRTLDAGGTNTAVGSTTLTVTTNNGGGYNLNVKDDSTPAFTNGSSSFTDFSGGAGSPETWNVTDDYAFGFSAYGAAIDDSYDNGSTSECSTSQDPNNSSLQWNGFNGGTDVLIGSRGSATSVDGQESTFCVASEQTGTGTAPTGTYTTTITATAITQA